MYLTNVERLALGLEGTPDPTQAQVQAAVAATGYTGYVAFDYKAAAPTRTGTGAAGGGTGGATGGGTGGTGTVKRMRRR